jgi:glycosyltransferase involved in cell wall biosynthesis
VHLRNIYRSTGAGRTARQITEHLAVRSDVNLRVLADAGDRESVVPLVNGPWSDYRYHTFSTETSRQQARWFFLDRPEAESFWPAAEITYCTAESYVPVSHAKLVVTAHDAGYFEQGSHRRDIDFWKTRLKWELLYKKLTRRADMFHTVSAFSAERLGHFFPDIKSRIHWIHNGVTPHFFQPVPISGTSYLHEMELDRRPFVLVPGGLHFRKNAEMILEAIPTLLKRFPDLVIAIVNHIHPQYVSQALSLGQRVKMLGFVSDDELHALYTAAQVVWYPSRYEGFGLPVIEAMACGASVVASNSSSIPEIAGSAAILRDPASVIEHVEAISGLLEDEPMRIQLSRVGRERAQLFTWEASAEQLAFHFQRLL